VDDQEKVPLELPDQPLSQPPQPDNLPAGGAIDGRIERANEKGTGKPDALERAAGYARPQGVKVKLDVWKFGHADSNSIGV
jgi:hypothetical protein